MKQFFGQTYSNISLYQQCVNGVSILYFIHSPVHIQHNIDGNLKVFDSIRAIVAISRLSYKKSVDFCRSLWYDITRR